MQLDKNFEEILADFFKKYDKRQLRHNKPHKISVKFEGNEDEVMEHLCKKYDVDPKTIAGIDLSSPSQFPSDSEHSGSVSAQEISTASADKAKGEESKEKIEEKVEEAEASPDEASAESDKKPKSKKKLVIIILIVILLAAAGAAGYLFKDKIFGKTTATGQETPQENTEEATPGKDEVEKTEESPKAATDEQTAKEEDKAEKVNDEGESDEETSGEGK